MEATEFVARASGIELTRTVLDSVRWLAKELSRSGRTLKAGQTILCGSVADLISIESACRVVVTTDRYRWYAILH